MLVCVSIMWPHQSRLHETWSADQHCHAHTAAVLYWSIPHTYLNYWFSANLTVRHPLSVNLRHKWAELQYKARSSTDLSGFLHKIKCSFSYHIDPCRLQYRDFGRGSGGGGKC